MDTPKCPKCGALMIRRIAQKGDHKGKSFWGCAKYPLCKAIINIPIESNRTENENTPNNDIPISTPFKEQPKTPLTDKQKYILTKLRDQLLDISTNNRSVRINHIYDQWAFDIHWLIDVYGKDKTNNILENALKRKSQFTLLPRNSLNEKTHKLSEKILKLYRNIKEIEVEKGLYDLNIGFPFLIGRTTENKIIQAPILLMPVKLEQNFTHGGEPCWTITQDKDTPVVLNKTLLMALSKYNGSVINPEIYELEIPDELFGPGNFMRWVTDQLNLFGVTCQLNNSVEYDEIEELPEYNISEFPGDINAGMLKVHQCAVLGHFPQANSSILNDYEYFLKSHQEEISNLLPLLNTELFRESEENKKYPFDSNIQSDMSDTPENVDFVPEKENVFLLPTDSSQEKIILSLENEKIDGMVVWGPPGTGKSQTIVNVIGHCLSKGKTVLMVCQKRAALDVVYDRLDNLGLGKFIGVVHDSRKDRKDLYLKLENHANPNPQDTTTKPFDYDNLSYSIEGQTKKLNDVYKKLHEKTKYDLTPLELYRNPKMDIPSSIVFPDFAEIENDGYLKNITAQLDSYQNIFSSIGVDSAWKMRTSFENMGANDERAILQVLDRAISDKNIIKAIKHRKYFDDIKKYGSLTIPANPSLQKDELHCRVDKYFSYNSFGKYFKLEYWKIRKIVLSEKNDCSAIIKQYASLIDTGLKKYIQKEHLKKISDKVISLDDITPLLIELKTSIESNFDNFIVLDRKYNKFSVDTKAYIGMLQSKLESGDIPLSFSWGALLKTYIYEKWIIDIEAASPVPNEIRTGIIDNVISEYRANIDTKCNVTSRWLEANLNNKKIGREAVSLMRKLRGYVTKKRKIPSIRKLNEELLSYNYHKLTIPCWLVSPETVSEVFPLVKGLFDLIIFDEASQCPVKNALPAVFRAKKVIVAGDEKQLPPLTLFESSIENGAEDIKEEIDALDSTSFLNLSSRVPLYNDFPLSWHYRSKHEELISFSNHAFYNGLMRTCPNCRTFDTRSVPAIEWIQVNGYWVDRCNEIEADRVIQLIYDQLKNEPTASLGIITFNAEQKDLIKNKIDKLRNENEEFNNLLIDNEKKQTDEQLFIKNIENVQGDERDIIIFSIGYAPSAPGERVMQQFGLLNLEGGENRLNVAITRAKDKVIIVCSINPETDLSTSTSKYRGPKLLQKYLIYAKAVSNKEQDRIASVLSDLNPSMKVTNHENIPFFDSIFEEEVYIELKNRGYNVHSQVGQSGFLIDLAIVHPLDPTKYVLGIECDGAKYHSAQSARERDVFRQKYLERRGWKIHRVWSTRWWKNKKQEVLNIDSLIKSMCN